MLGTCVIAILNCFKKLSGWNSVCALLNRIKLWKWGITYGPDECMECLVCFEPVCYDKLCFCDHLMADKIFGTSSATSGVQKESHAFCIACLKMYTKMAHETMPFARGGLGLKCMAEHCENPITWHEIKDHLSDQRASICALENQCAEFCVAMAGLLLERCPECNCLVEISTEFVQRFRCPNCLHEMCRKCKEKWTEEHQNLTCEQLAKLKNYKEDPLDKILAEAIIHKCVKCNLQFIKNVGCNEITCSKCNAKQCYCCRKATSIMSAHFCSCSGDKLPDKRNASKCSICGKCLQFSNVQKMEEQRVERIRKEHEPKSTVIWMGLNKFKRANS